MEDDKTYTKGELFMLTVIWHIKATEFGIIDEELPVVRFDIILALVAFLTLIKLFLQFEFTPTFGPLYKMMQRMITELVKFLCIWVIQLASFASVAVLAFGSLEVLTGGWFLAFLLYDLAWYTDHRIGHRVGFFWAMHQVHHSSPYHR